MPLDASHVALIARVLAQPDLSQMAAPAPATAGTAATVWRDLGWPATIIADPSGKAPDVARCGPVITAFATLRGDRIVLKRWFMDRKLAGEAQAPAAPQKPELAQPKVKF